DKDKVRARADLRIGALGSGSDYTPFLQHLGIPSLNISFGGEDAAGIYHSIYDDFYFYTHFLDTDFVYGRALAQLIESAVNPLAAISVKIAQSEQQLLDAAGLAHRDWYRHLLYAPGFYTGYGVKTMPGVREAIEQGQYDSAPSEIARVARALEREAEWLEAIT